MFPPRHSHEINHLQLLHNPQQPFPGEISPKQSNYLTPLQRKLVQKSRLSNWSSTGSKWAVFRTFKRNGGQYSRQLWLFLSAMGT